MTNNTFYDKWNKYDKVTQDVLKEKTQEIVNNGYDTNKIANYIKNNFDITSNGKSKNNIITNNLNKGLSSNLQKPIFINSNNNSNDIGISPKGEKYNLTPIQKAQRDFYDIIKRNPQARTVLNTQKNQGVISNIINPDHRGGTINTTYNEDINKPSELTAYDEEYIKELSKYTNGKENKFSKFKEYWNEIKKEKEKIPDEIKNLTLEKFNTLSDEEKLKTYKLWNRHQEQLRKEKLKEEQNENNDTQFMIEETKQVNYNQPIVATSNKISDNFESNIFNSNSNGNENNLNLELPQVEKYNKYYKELVNIREDIRKKQELSGENSNNTKWERIFNYTKKKYEIDNGISKNGKYYEMQYNNGKSMEGEKSHLINGYKVTNDVNDYYKYFIKPNDYKYNLAMTNLNNELWKGEIYTDLTTFLGNAGKLTDFFGSKDWGKIGEKYNGKVSTFFLAKFLYGDGSPEYFDDKHFITEKVKNDRVFSKKIEEIKNVYKNDPDGFETYLKNLDETISLGETVFDDFPTSFGTNSWKVQPEYNNNGKLKNLKIKMYDLYDFHFTTPHGDMIGNRANDSAVYLQENGHAKPFQWTMNINIPIK